MCLAAMWGDSTVGTIWEAVCCSSQCECVRVRVCTSCYPTSLGSSVPISSLEVALGTPGGWVTCGEGILSPTAQSLLVPVLMMVRTCKEAATRGHCCSSVLATTWGQLGCRAG